MSKLIYILSIILFFSITRAQAQSVSADNNISKREMRFVSKQMGRRDRITRKKDKRDAIKEKRIQKKMERKHRKMKRKIARNKRDWGTKRSRAEHAKHYKAMHGKKGWFAREHPKRHLKESMYP